MTLHCKNKVFLPFGNLLPVELQEKILYEREIIIQKERDAIIKSLSIDELLKALDKKINNMAEYNDVNCISFKGNNNVMCILKFDVLDIVDSIESFIQNNDVEHQVELFWESLSEPQKIIVAADCFDNINTPKSLFINDDDDEFDIDKKEDYCFNYFQEKFNNNSYQIVDSNNLEISN